MWRIGAIHRERLRRRMVRARLAERRVLGAAHRGGQPQPAVAPEHRVVVVDARLPDALAAPVGRRLQRIERRRMAGPEVERHLRIAHRRLERRRGVLDRIEDRQHVGAVLRRSEERAVRVDGREAPIARDQIVQVLLLVHPVAQRDDDVALDALRARRLGERQLAFGDAIGPVAVVGERDVAEAGQLAEHLLAGLARLHAPPPRVGAGGERAERRRNRARGLLAELMAADAAGVLHRADPLRSASAARGCCSCRRTDRRRESSASSTSRWPGSSARPRPRSARRRGDRQALSGLGRRLGAVDQAVAARPHAVVRRRQIGHDESAAIVGDDALDVADGQVARFGDDPDARFRSLRAR